MFSCAPTLLAYTSLEPQSTVTWNPSDKSTLLTLSNANLTVKGTITNSGTVRATSGVTSGSFYYEIVINIPASGTTGSCAGITNGAMALTANVGSTSSSIGFLSNGSIIRSNANQGTVLGTLVDGDVIGIAVNLTVGRIFFRKNGGAWVSSGNPVAGTGGFTFVVSGTVYPAACCSGAVQTWTARFASASWLTPAPTGYGQIM